MKRFLLLLLFVAAGALHAKTWRDERCGIVFELPKGWSVRQVDTDWWKHSVSKEDVRCHLGIRPEGWSDEVKQSDGFLRDDAMEILVVDRPLLDAARLGGFMKLDEGWKIPGRGRDEDADEVRTACCQGVRGSSWGRTRNKAGDLGTTTRDAAVLNDGRNHSVYIETAESERFDAELTSIINSFRFTR